MNDLKAIRNTVYSLLLKQLPSSAIYQKLKESNEDLVKRLHLSEKWQNNDMTNFEYLMFVNVLAGRSLQDITQYPVFPWILTDYDSISYDIW